MLHNIRNVVQKSCLDFQTIARDIICISIINQDFILLDMVCVNSTTPYMLSREDVI